MSAVGTSCLSPCLPHDHSPFVPLRIGNMEFLPPSRWVVKFPTILCDRTELVTQPKFPWEEWKLTNKISFVKIFSSPLFAIYRAQSRYPWSRMQYCTCCTEGVSHVVNMGAFCTGAHCTVSVKKHKKKAKNEENRRASAIIHRAKPKVVGAQTPRADRWQTDPTPLRGRERPPPRQGNCVRFKDERTKPTDPLLSWCPQWLRTITVITARKCTALLFAEIREQREGEQRRERWQRVGNIYAAHNLLEWQFSLPWEDWTAKRKHKSASRGLFFCRSSNWFWSSNWFSQKMSSDWWTPEWLHLMSSNWFSIWKWINAIYELKLILLIKKWAETEQVNTCSFSNNFLSSKIDLSSGDR